jgi:hypothetical protein
VRQPASWLLRPRLRPRWVTSPGARVNTGVEGLRGGHAVGWAELGSCAYIASSPRCLRSCVRQPASWLLRPRLRPAVRPYSDAKRKLRIVTLVVSGRSLTRPLHDAPPIPLYTTVPGVPGATRTTLGFGICPSFKGYFLSRRAKP